MKSKFTLSVFWRQLQLRACFFITVVLLTQSEIQASHIRAGEIIATRIDQFQRTYEFTFIGYRDNLSGVRFGLGVFRFGDGNIEEIPPITNEVQITENLFRVEFRLVHTYAANGAYTVSYEEDYRNAGIANMDDSGNTTFYVESQIVIDGAVGLNSTPRFTYPPIDDGKVGVAFEHNPIAFDPDDDSLSYELVIPQQALGLEVNRYRLPNEPEFYQTIRYDEADEAGFDSPKFSIDQEGNMLWDAPGDFLNLSGSNECPPGIDECAEYNVAFKVTEWKKLGDNWVPYGYVIRDMQITISDGENERPQLEVPGDICVEAGTSINEVIAATDPDGHKIEISAFGGPFEVLAPATISPDPFEYQDSPAELAFEWNTVCGHIKGSSYTVGFRANDLPEENGVRIGPSLTDVGTWSIDVIGPAPVGLSIGESIQTVELGWDRYACGNAENLQVWRRVGPHAFEPNDCEVGIPEGSGYNMVGQVSGTQVSFIDDFELASGAQYCYRLVAIFPRGGISYASEEICVTLPVNSPVITQVDVASTSITDGEIRVQWLPGSEDHTETTYQVLRYDNINGNGNPLVVANNLERLEFLDVGLNTNQRQYGYQIVATGTEGRIDTAAFASQVNLDLRPGVEEIELNWEAKVPWSNQSQRFLYHYIYRNHMDEFDSNQLVLMDSMRADGGEFQYKDDGSIIGELLEERSYCYFVMTAGTYENRPTIPEPLLNSSQVACSRPNDVTPPCKPDFLQIVNLNSCENKTSFAACSTEFYNELTWQDGDLSETCDDDIQHYNVYFSHSGDESAYEVVAAISESSFIHRNLSSYKGCYRISAVDRSGNESELSEEVCNDNCTEMELPNVFTPNQDGKNDTFIPYASFLDEVELREAFCDLFIEKVVFQVFDRSGKEVYAMNSEEPEKSKFIQWDGRANNGNDLPAGIYYYQANVQFDVLASSEAHKIFNGWVQILK